MTDNTLRQRLAIPMPPRIARLPRTKHGLPVPYIAEEHEDGSPNLGMVDSAISGSLPQTAPLLDLRGKAGAGRADVHHRAQLRIRLRLRMQRSADA